MNFLKTPRVQGVRIRWASFSDFCRVRESTPDFCLPINGDGFPFLTPTRSETKRNSQPEPTQEQQEEENQ